MLLSIALLVGVVVGGLGSLSGALFGAVFIHFVPNWAQEASKAAPWALYGTALIVCMYAMPRGVAGLLATGWGRLARSRPGMPDHRRFSSIGSLPQRRPDAGNA